MRPNTKQLLLQLQIQLRYCNRLSIVNLNILSYMQMRTLEPYFEKKYLHLIEYNNTQDEANVDCFKKNIIFFRKGHEVGDQGNLTVLHTFKKLANFVHKTKHVYFNTKKNYGQEVSSPAPHAPVADCPEERDVPSLNVQTETLLVWDDQSQQILSGIQVPSPLQVTVDCSILPSRAPLIKG